MVSTKYVAAAALTAAALTTSTIVAASSASAQERRGFYVAKVIYSGYAAPLQFAVGQAVWVADSGYSHLTTAVPHKLYATGGDPSKGGDLAGVGINSAAGEVGYTWTGPTHYQSHFVLLRNGKQVYQVNLAAYEGSANPDGNVHYGVDHPSACVRDALNTAHIPVNYTGQKDSHPYAVAYLGNHQWAVADAGGNDIVKVDVAAHRVSTIAVLPRQPFRVTKAFQQANHLPACVVGVTYWTESVPTDVEVGPGATLYVSSLPGGPEGPGVGPRGSVYTISTAGRVTRIATGFADATNLAVRPNGYVYVVELGRDIARVVNGRPSPVISINGVAGVEWAHNHLYASTAPAVIGGKGPGKIVELGYV